MAALASGELDWSKITLEPTTTPIPTATGSLDLSGIILDGPGTTSAAVGIDLSGYTLEPPESDTPAAGVLRPQIWTGPVSAPRERQVRQLWLLSQSKSGCPRFAFICLILRAAENVEDLPTGNACMASAGWPAELVGVLIAISLLGLIANCVQLHLLKKVMNRTLVGEEGDIEMGDR
ncbi:hypothetical protein Pmar_PMAR019770 [Perkinsus marinus ATCC 50983]|uniref:Uncharacterized protein n=1 Tax=Perkinsus marinus (strain ATCC 50983 / TXsc) TaxID=423536 RepID=C5KZ36_PERM5|nr:hypothetical protein Pmar_PMAR019770 [Perkinsus marinus ATCC 50983]EER10251.1 hypothetical protein Pmar_PMAR019770 [Perkinsus marinus ATCC 50983]|eukprot:XP_002778456.1 hypothetical protein Pmar_PMAR019770 [Perkinsus marinus ATCC 50983]